MKDTFLTDYEEIVKAGQAYLDSCRCGDSSVMKSAFHKNATINGNPIQTLFDGVDQAGKSEVKGRIDVVDAIGDIAVIRITMENYFGENYVDLHLLKKEADGWKILAKAFTGYANDK